MDADEEAFWDAVSRMSFSGLRKVAEKIYGSWRDRECPADALNFAAALAEYAEERDQ